LTLSGDHYMKKPKSITVKTGTVDEFMAHVKNVMHAADKGEPIKPSYTLTFTDPKEMLHFLSDKKIELINLIRNHPDSITNIAHAIKRNRAAVYRDIREMKKFGLVQIHEEINVGHGRHKIVELVADRLKLEAYI
jgi:predicted transcriptional regulator